MSASATRLSRLLALVPWLAVNDGISMEAAAAHFGVSVPVLEDDLNLLICCGLPGYTHAELVDIQFWDDGIIHVLDPQTIGAPLRLSGDEAAALLIALRVLAQIPGDHDRDALLGATLRLQAAVGGLDDGVVIEAGVNPEHAEVIAGAISGDEDLRIAYGAANDAVTERVVLPMRTVTHEGRTYLEAHCRTAGAVRTFRLDRLLSIEAVPRTVHDPGLEPTAGGHAPGTPDAGAGSVTARIAVRADAPWAAEALGLTPEGVLPDGRPVGRIPVYDERWVVRTVLGLAGAAEVLDPQDLRAAVGREAAEALAAYA